MEQGQQKRHAGTANCAAKPRGDEGGLRDKRQGGMKGQEIGMDMEDGMTSTRIAILGPRIWLGQLYMRL